MLAELDRLAILAFDVGRSRVRENEGVFVGLVLEEVEDAFLLKQPRNEIEVAFPILDAVLPLRGTYAPDGLEPAGAMFLKDLLDDVQGRELLEDSAIDPARKEPQPGNDLGIIAAIVAIPHRSGREPLHDAVETPRLAP